VDGAAIKTETALEHCRGVEEKPAEQQAIIDAIIVPETLAKNEDGVNRAHSIKNDRDNKIQLVGTDAQASLPYSKATDAPSPLLPRQKELDAFLESGLLRRDLRIWQ
jgi:hypothetical protein